MAWSGTPCTSWAPPPVISCSDIYRNAGGDWVGVIASQFGASGNISRDPLYCGPAIGDFSLDAASPCLAPACGRMGALGQGCAGFRTDVPSGATQPVSWGVLK